MKHTVLFVVLIALVAKNKIYERKPNVKEQLNFISKIMKTRNLGLDSFFFYGGGGVVRLSDNQEL